MDRTFTPIEDEIKLYAKWAVVSADFNVIVSSLGENRSTVALYSANLSDEDITADIEGIKTEYYALAEWIETDKGTAKYQFTNITFGPYKLALYKEGYLISISNVNVIDEMEEQSVCLRSLGDVDNNNDVTVSDIIMIRDIILEVPSVIGKLSDDDREAADVNRDDQITVSDIISVRDRILEVLDEDYRPKS